MKQIYKQLGKVRPTVEGDWSIDKTYTLLSIVYDEVGNASYISRKDVPAGIQITNKEYWTRFSNTKVNSDSIVLLSKIQDDGLINSYDLQEAIDSFKVEDRRLGTFISFYEKPIGESTDYRWNLYQFNSNNIDDWNNTKYWQSIYYIQNKFLGLFSSEESLKRTRPFPIIGDYAFVGATLKEAVVYRCNNIGVWTRTNEKAKDYLSINLKGDITINEEGNWVIDGVDTGISSKGENGKTPLLRIKDYKWQVSYDGGIIYNDIPNSPIFVKEDDEDIIGDLQTDGVKLLKFADKEYNSSKFSGLGRVYLRKNIVNGKNVLTQGMINKPNTIYIIQYDYDLDNEEINVPENCTLDFQGGSFTNGIITCNNTYINSSLYYIFKCNISGTINNDYLNIEWVGGIGDNKTDCTEAFKRAELFNTKINKGIYKASNIKISNKRNFIGISRGDSVLQQIDGSSGDFVTLENWNHSIFKNITIKGGQNIIFVNLEQALIKFRTILNNKDLSYKSIISNINIENSEYNGLSILGKNDIDNSIHCDWNWVFTINNLYIRKCKRYCLYNKSTDNLFSNINCSNGGLANILDFGSSNMFVNLKLDGECCGEVLKSYTLDNYLNDFVGAALIIKGALTNYINCDIQSSQLQGLKIINSNRINFIGSINNCGLYFDGYINKNNLDYNESWDKVPAIYLKNVKYNNIECFLDQYDKINQINDFNYDGYCFSNNLKIIKNIINPINVKYNNLKLYELYNNNNINDGNKFIKEKIIKINSIIDKDIEDNSWYYATKSDNLLFNHETIICTKNKKFEIKKGIKLKENHVYLAIACCKCVEKYDNDSSLYFPYINIIASNVENVENIREYESYNYYTNYAANDKYIYNTIKQNDLFFIKAIFKVDKKYDEDYAFFRVYCLDDSKYIINNIRLYDLTEYLGVTDIDNSNFKTNINIKLFESFIYNSDIYKLDKYFNSVYYKINENNNYIPKLEELHKGTTAQRPTEVQIGFTYKDTDLNKWIIWNGEAWENIDGTALG